IINYTTLCPMLPTPFFLFNDTPTTEIYTLSLHDALPISPMYRCRRKLLAPSALPIPARRSSCGKRPCQVPKFRSERNFGTWQGRDRKSTRLNSSHVAISYAVFCLKKKKKKKRQKTTVHAS